MSEAPPTAPIRLAAGKKSLKVATPAPAPWHFKLQIDVSGEERLVQLLHVVLAPWL